MPSRARPISNLPELPEDPTDKATLQVEACADHGRRVALGMTVPGRDTVACASIAAAVVIGVGGPLATIYEAHAASFAPGWAACIACAQVVGATLFGLHARHRRG
jgi:hypothetical protein